jgi:hypothetical protein
MDDESSVSTKSECVKALETLELRNWLSHHNKNISKRYEHHEKNERQRKQLLHGLSSERNPEKALGTILELAFPRIVKKNGLPANVSLNANACNRAVQTMLHDADAHDRYNLGLHPVTLLAEQRRKVVLNALTDFDYPYEDKRLSRRKLAVCLEARGSPPIPGSRGFTPKLTPLPAAQLNGHHHHHGGRTHHNTGTAHHEEFSPIRKFEPKWEHYDVMRTRWHYLQPQVRNLKHEGEAYNPEKFESNDKSDTESVLHGSVVDMHHHNRVHERILHRTSSVSEKSQKLVADRDEKASRYYRPTPCVRY